MSIAGAGFFNITKSRKKGVPKPAFIPKQDLPPAPKEDPPIRRLSPKAEIHTDMASYFDLSKMVSSSSSVSTTTALQKFNEALKMLNVQPKHGDIVNFGDYRQIESYFVVKTGKSFTLLNNTDDVLEIPLEVTEKLSDVVSYYNNVKSIGDEIGSYAYGKKDKYRKNLFPEARKEREYKKAAEEIAKNAHIVYYPLEGQTFIQYNGKQWTGKLKNDMDREIDIIETLTEQLAQIRGKFHFEFSYVIGTEKATQNSKSATNQQINQMFPSDKWTWKRDGHSIVFEGPEKEASGLKFIKWVA